MGWSASGGKGRRAGVRRNVANGERVCVRNYTWLSIGTSFSHARPRACPAQNFIYTIIYELRTALRATGV